MPAPKRKPTKRPRGKQKGTAKSGGRKKGTPNVKSVEIKAAITSAFDQLGGVKNLVLWAQRNPTEFYKLWGKLLPKEITTPEGQPIKVQITEVVVRSREEADAVLALNLSPKSSSRKS